MKFARPEWLVLLIPTAYCTWQFARRSLADLTPARARVAVCIRSVILLMLIMAIAGAGTVRNVDQSCVIFALDVSDSVPKLQQERALKYVNEALRTAARNQKAGIIVFGQEALVELAPCETKKVSKIYSVPTTGQTDISQALGLATALFPENCRKKIVLLSDGNETIGNSIEQAFLAGSQNICIDTIQVSSGLRHECLLEKMLCPSNVKIGEPFDIKILAAAKTPTTAQLKLLRNGTPVEERIISLAKGKSLFVLEQSINKPGSYEFKAILEPAEDTRPENNVALAYTMVKGKPKVLYIDSRPPQGFYLANALGQSNIEVDLKPPSALPSSLADLRAYDAVVLSDVPAWHLTPEQMAVIKSGVKDLGIGFAMVGGEYGFGAGGYYDTPIEECLPVEMSIRKKKVLPSLAVVIVMDKSGSMAEPEGDRTKIELANDAAASVVSLLQPIDQVGVVVCHSYPVVAVPLVPASNKGAIYREISTIRAEGGGIYANPSLQIAYAMLKDAPVRQKHVILLADGNDVDDAGPETLATVQTMRSAKITVSAVAFGEGKDVPFLKAAAAIGGGYFYLAHYARDLKAIFTRDVMTVSRSLYVEEPFVPRIDTSSLEFAGIDPRTIPPLLGYVVTSSKPTARIAAVSHKNDPIFAAWQYGLGKSIAFTSDCKARWAARWLSWPGYKKMWSQTIRSILRKSSSSTYQTLVD
ncbi:MAG: VWA domain-containing protein, partial [Armatimonadota bacterium]|nr:VWA domain-containing protein [Armatimonadota bacterium]